MTNNLIFRGGFKVTLRFIWHNVSIGNCKLSCNYLVEAVIIELIEEFILHLEQRPKLC